MGDLALFKALTGGAFDRLNWKHSGEFDQNFSKVKCPGVCPGGAWAVLELTGTLALQENLHRIGGVEQELQTSLE